MTKPLARSLMVLGTASDVGKSTLVAGLGRALAARGVDVAPFKAQTMARNAYVCADGAEIGVAQAVQAIAARIEPCSDHNPILLKPEPELRSTLIVHGRSRGSLHYRELIAQREMLLQAMRDSLGRLRARHQLVILEGAGSPAEVNLQAHDLPNLAAARAADAEIILVGDIDRGGVFASLVGTLQLLPDDVRARVRGLVINKLRGDARALGSGLEFLRERTGVPVLGVVPHLGELALPDEDSVAQDRFRGLRRARLSELEIAIVDTPCLANFEDALPLAAASARERGVHVRLTASPRELLEADLVLLLGSKSTVDDLEFLRAEGIAAALALRAQRDAPILGICGGAQLLGTRIEDPERVESSRMSAKALGLLPIVTRFAREKVTRRVRGELIALGGSAPVDGFELHHGRITSEGPPALKLEGDRAEGCVRGAVIATMVHRVLDHASAELITWLYARRGETRAPRPLERVEDPYDRLARQIEQAIDVSALLGLMRA